MLSAAAVVSDPSRIITKKFYLEYRMAVGYAKDSLDEDIPDFRTLEEWEKKKSTKMDLCAQICRYTLQRDDAPEVEFKDGKAAFTALPPLSQGQIASQETRILIYQEFPSLGRLLRNVSFAPTSRHLF